MDALSRLQSTLDDVLPWLRSEVEDRLRLVFETEKERDRHTQPVDFKTLRQALAVLEHEHLRLAELAAARAMRDAIGHVDLVQPIVLSEYDAARRATEAAMGER